MAARNGKGATQEAPPEKKNDRPVWSRKRWTGSANIEVAVFEKMVNEGKEDEFLTWNVSAKRTFKDADQGYKSVQGFRAEDTPVLIQLLQQADAFISDQQNRE